MKIDDIVITAYGSDHSRIARLNRLRGAFGACLGYSDGELAERTGLARLHDHKGHLDSVWVTDVDEKMWAPILTDIWRVSFGEGDHVSSALLTDVENKRAAYYVNYLK
jgi:hypothetical protein